MREAGGKMTSDDLEQECERLRLENGLLIKRQEDLEAELQRLRAEVRRLRLHRTKPAQAGDAMSSRLKDALRE